MRYAARLFVPSLALLLVGTSCTWVSSNTFEEKRASLDEDGDGCPKSTDCDDDNPFQCVLFVEVPYDGWDNDCSGGDLVDVDGDGVPGILKADWEARNTDERRADWPGGAQTDDIDCRDVTPAQLEEYRFIDVTDTKLLSFGGNYEVSDKYSIGVVPQWDFEREDFRTVQGTVIRSFPDFDFMVYVSYDQVRGETRVGAQLGQVNY